MAESMRTHEPRWSLARIAAAIFAAAALLWAAWATRMLLDLRERRVVTVALNGLVRDFVAAESRRAGAPEDAAARTRAYLQGLDRAIGELEHGGEIVLVRESVLGRAVPDRTAQVRARVAEALERAP